MARQARHTRPSYATPRHATPLRRAHFMLPAGPADADADSDAATAAARCLYRDCTHVRVCVHCRKVLRNLSDAYVAQYTCLRRLARLTDETLLQSNVRSYVGTYSLSKGLKKKKYVENVSLSPDFTTSQYRRDRYLTCNQVHYRSFVLIPGVRANVSSQVK